MCPGEGIRSLGAGRCPICGQRVYVKTDGRFGRHWTTLTALERRRLVAAAAMWNEPI